MGSVIKKALVWAVFIGIASGVILVRIIKAQSEMMDKPFIITYPASKKGR